ncbi:hypothetical protein G647_09772 [Cladophialophora carrionii CBS 160.54]|uniref:Uncharacterized protein n=1 Tax=Cladophialophora carrionii CBS 160.54 TaxID=1279043 RepID=V9DJP9_9EURO|nr:uncharacterized protein G647_09772 [Cladophialophora carrionii CBS 160.54]ETI27090.1 hypothetical protein G647_09772 [Cladophialophora carrionii CBS 160.54]
MGPPRDPSTQSPPSSAKSLPYRNSSRHASSNLRKLYRISAQDVGDRRPQEHSYHSVSTVLPTSPHLPPTPPGANVESDSPAPEEIAPSIDAAVFRSSLVTPINQNSPPTPDNTPPRERNASYIRPFLGTHSSMASTQAESFTTAREDFTSDVDSDGIVQHHEHGFQWPLSSVDKFGAAAHRLRPSALPRSPLVNLYSEEPVVSRSPETLFDKPRFLSSESDAELHTGPVQLNPTSSPEAVPSGDLVQIRIDTAPVIPSESVESPYPVRYSVGPQDVKRGKSLRERLLQAQSQDPSASTEKFADIIGWNSSVPIGDVPVEERRSGVEDNRRFSGISTTSTVEAYVVDQAPPPQRKTTLRHVNKHESLRSVSSPLPASNRNSVLSNSDSPHRLVHKKARLSNQNRWSFGSEVSRSYSLASSAVLPKTEVIRVAVIPERSSSLNSSAHSSQRQSLSNSSGRTHSRKGSDNPPSSWHHKKALSESVERGRDPLQAPLIPARSSSLSAPTSRATSRANSITSEHLQVQRKQAEKDLRKTLDRMESERLLNSLRGSDLSDQVHDSDGNASARPYGKSSRPGVIKITAASPTNLIVVSGDGERDSNALGLVVPGTQEWAALRPPSIFDTPFSQPSFQSASPEINEAKAINYFPHNNHSLQLIEPFSVAESRAVREVQKQNLPEIEVESPLRNPRQPPDPPQFKVIPPTPADESADRQLGVDARSSVKRPGGSRSRSESFMSSISRNLSLKNARNRKADQDLDNNLHPMWRPRAFWDDIDNARSEAQQQERSLDEGVVNNSLGLPQERIVITGPVSLIRRISERRRQNRGIVKQSSHSSLARIRASRKMHRSSRLGVRFHIPHIGVKAVQERMLHAKQRKEDERREKRRAELRRSIGANVVSQGDSRFPASNTSLAREI